MDFQQGLICRLTGEKATFENECADFKLDEIEIENPLDGVEKMLPDELKLTLSPEIIEKFRMEQRLLLGVLSGLVVGVVGAILWGVITVTTGYQIGYMALAIGAGVGLTIRITGKGIDTVFGIWGAGIALLSVLLGNFLSIIGFLANSEGLGYIETLLLFDYSYLPQVMVETFSILDLLFYGIAIYEGFRFSFRKITEDKVVELRDGKITNR
jgi:hypothetical protein